MGPFLETLIGGLMTGMLYSLVALGFVLIFKATGVLNFAQGESIMLSTFVAFSLLKWGVPYSMVNTVIDLEADRRIAWQTRGPGPIGKVLGGRIWRYELEPTDGGTLVRETWDITQESPLSRASTRRMAGLTRKNMEQTLARIEELVSG